MKQLFTFILTFYLSFLFAQLTENFSDGNFTSNPTWSGSSDLFIVDNEELRSNNPIENIYYLSTPSNAALDRQWDFYLNLKFSTSGANYVDAFLLSDNSDLTLAQNGYFVRIGNTADEISLYLLQNGTASIIIDGTDGIVNSSTNNPFNIRVKRDNSNVWTLETDDGALGNYINQGSVTDNAISTSSFFGFKIVQSTLSGAVNNHFFDNISIGSIVLDVIPPSLQSVSVINSTQIDLVFSENLEETSAENIGNYSIIPANVIQTANLDLTSKNIVHLLLNTPLQNTVQNTITSSNVQDLSGNLSVIEIQNFTFLQAFTAKAGDIVINEFMCDPTPIIGLPEVEYIEIYNKSLNPIDLIDWKIGDISDDGTIPNSILILPGEYKVLCSTTNAGLFPNAIGVTSFPSLNNSGDDIVLKDSSGLIIDKLTYDLSWYQDELKEDGGYAIELKNPLGICVNSTNWSASISVNGGTPGEQNSNYDISPDTQIPSLISLEAYTPNFLSIVFSEKMDSLSIVNSIFAINPNLSVSAKYLSDSYPKTLLVEFSEDLIASQIYTISIPNVADCSQNSTSLNGEFSLSEEAVLGDLIINEILFNPITNGSDFVELKNVSNKIINLKNITLANFDNDTISNFKQIGFSRNLKPNEFIVLTSDSTSQKQVYPFAVSGKFIQMSLPTYNNDSSTIYVFNNYTLLDKVSYSEDWHFSLLDDNDGKSLEKIDPSLPSDDKNNWHTASSAYNFATPGFENSQLLIGEANGIVSLTNAIFSPDNDGFEDILQINYKTINNGMLASVKVFDDRGRLIHTLLQNEYLGTNGSLTWDGTLETKQKASIGTYLIVFDAFDLDGKKLVKKLAFVLAGK